MPARCIPRALERKTVVTELLIPTPAEGLVHSLRVCVRQGGRKRHVCSAHHPGEIGRGADQHFAHAFASGVLAHEQVVEDEDARHRDRREARVQLGKADRFRALVSQENRGFSMPKAFQQEGVGSSRVARPPVELPVAVKERYERLQIKDGGLANGDGSHGV